MRAKIDLQVIGVNNHKEDQYYTVPEAARMLGVSSATVWRWIDAGKLRAFRVGPRGIRIKRQDLEAVIRPARPKDAEKSEKDRETEHVWEGYDPEKVREALKRSAGALIGVDRDALLADIHGDRQQSNKTRPE